MKSSMWSWKRRGVGRGNSVPMNDVEAALWMEPRLRIVMKRVTNSFGSDLLEGSTSSRNTRTSCNTQVAQLKSMDM